MPWLSLPLTQSKIAKSLSAKLCINSIPSLIVLDKTGKYITNDARADIGKIGNGVTDEKICSNLVNTWMSTKAVPIEKANLGVVSSIFSKLKNGYNYVTGGSAEDGDTSEDGEDNDDDKKISDEDGNGDMAPQSQSQLTSAILAFFKATTKQLENHPSLEVRNELLKPMDGETETNGDGDGDGEYLFLSHCIPIVGCCFKCNCQSWETQPKALIIKQLSLQTIFKQHFEHWGRMNIHRI